MEKLAGAYAIYLYDSSGTSGYMEELDVAHDAILQDAIATIKGCDSLATLERTLVNYTTARDLQGICDVDVSHIVTWVKAHELSLTQGRYDHYVVPGGEEPGYEVMSVGEFRNPFVGREGEEITLLVGWCPETQLIHGVSKFINYNKLKRVNVVLDKLDNYECPEMVKALLRQKMTDATSHFAACSPAIDLTYYEVDYNTDFVGQLYRNGLRIRIGNKWYLQLPPEAVACRPTVDGVFDDDVSSLPVKSVLEMVDHTVAMGFFKDWLELVDEIEWSVTETSKVRPVDIAALYANGAVCRGSQVVWTEAGQKLSDRPMSKLLDDLGFDVTKINVKSISYEDPYFYTPAEWVTLQLMLREMRFANGATINVRVANLSDEKARYAFRMPYAGVSAVRAGLYSNYSLLKEDAELFADWLLQVCSSRGLEGVTVDYTSERLNHGRVMTLLCDEGGEEKTHRILFDRGLDLLTFSDRRFTVQLTSRALEGWIEYAGDFYIVHEVS